MFCRRNILSFPCKILGYIYWFSNHPSSCISHSQVTRQGPMPLRDWIPIHPPKSNWSKNLIEIIHFQFLVIQIIRLCIWDSFTWLESKTKVKLLIRTYNQVSKCLSDVIKMIFAVTFLFHCLLSGLYYCIIMWAAGVLIYLCSTLDPSVILVQCTSIHHQ